MPTLRTVVSGTLGGAAQVLSLTAKLLDASARALRPPATPPDTQAMTAPPGVTPPAATMTEAASTAEVIEAVEREIPASQLGTVQEPTRTPILDDSPHLRTFESHIEELASKPAAQVIAGIDSLSTDELRLLTEYETTHRNRKSVLAAIERAALPGGGDAAPLSEAGGVPTSGTMDPAGT